MIQTTRSKDRHHHQSDWLSAYWHFSFLTYNDPNNMNFGPLRVFNDDVVAPGRGFPEHGHQDMEVVTYIIEGALEHKDNMDNVGVIRPGEIQRMSAGSGVRHSEYNHSQKDPVHFVQLWITPAENNLPPEWDQKSFSLAERSGKLLPIAVPAGKNGSNHSSAVKIHQDATIYTSLLDPGQSATLKLGEGRRAYIFVIGGNLKLNGETLNPGDQARVTGESELQFAGAPDSGATGADFLLLDLP
jgi:redox-sensitive bicupin YhaK (pirin superfamily)